MVRLASENVVPRFPPLRAKGFEPSTPTLARLELGLLIAARLGHFPLDFQRPASIAVHARRGLGAPAAQCPAQSGLRAVGPPHGAAAPGENTAMPSTKPLSKTQHLALETAADRPSGLLLPLPVDLPARGAVRQRLLAGLLAAGFVEEVRAADPTAASRTDETGRGGVLRITAQGLAAIGRMPSIARKRGDQALLARARCG